MNDISLTILPETADDAPRRSSACTSAPSVRAAMPRPPIGCASRWRTGSMCRSPRASARCWSARCGLSPIRIGEAKALLLGPLTVEPPFRERGIGQALIERALEGGARQGPPAGHPGRRRAVLRQMRLQAHPARRASIMPGPVDPARLLVAELVAGAFDGVSGPIRPEWEAASRRRPQRPSRAQVPARLPSSSNRPSRPAKTGSTPMPRTTLASRIFRPIQSSPL